MTTLPDLPFSPAAARNAEPILAVLNCCLPGPARILEIASGTGQHAAHFAQARPDWHWQPTEPQAEALGAIAARCAGLANVAAPRALDIAEPPWALSRPANTTAETAVLAGPWDMVYCANLLHISPWQCCGALMAGAARVLTSRGVLVVYGPFWRAGDVPAPSNLSFDADLRSRNPAWGIRDLSAVEGEARKAGLVCTGRRSMPANNLSLIFQRAI